METKLSKPADLDVRLHLDCVGLEAYNLFLGTGVESGGDLGHRAQARTVARRLIIWWPEPGEFAVGLALLLAHLYEMPSA